MLILNELAANQCAVQMLLLVQSAMGYEKEALKMQQLSSNARAGRCSSFTGS